MSRIAVHLDDLDVTQEVMEIQLPVLDHNGITMAVTLTGRRDTMATRKISIARDGDKETYSVRFSHRDKNRSEFRVL
jgi:hypothetical protein